MEILKLLNKRKNNFFQKNKPFFKRLFFTLFLAFFYLILKKNVFCSFLTKNVSLTKNDNHLFHFGIFPYLVAGTVVNAFTFFLPFAKDWNKEGNEGKRKLNLIRKCFFLLILIFRIFFYLKEKQAFSWYNFSFFFVGSFIGLFLAEMLSVFGLGQGFSLILILNNLDSLYLNLKISNFYEKIITKTNFSVFLFFFLLLLLFILLENLIIEIPFIKAQKKMQQQDFLQVLPFKLNLTGTSALFWKTNIIVFLSLMKDFFVFCFREKVSFLNNISHFFSHSFFFQNVFLFLAMLITTFIIYNPLKLANNLFARNVYLVSLTK